MEKLVNERLVFFLEKNNQLCKYQSGFRLGRSTTDHIASLANDIRKVLSSHESLLDVFLDIHKADDSVWIEGLLFKTLQTGNQWQDVLVDP